MKKILGLFLISLFAVSAQAQLLWKVSGNGLDKPSYVMGTHHLAPLGVKDKIEGMKQALSETTQVYGEVDIKEMMNQENMKLMQQVMVTQSDTTFQSLFTPEDYKAISAFCKDNMMFDLTAMPKVKPAFISNNIIVILYLKTMINFNPQEQLDTFFQMQAQEKGKKTAGLETIDFQFNLLYNSSSLKRQAELLLCTFKDQDNALRLAKRLTDLYVAQDIEGMHKLSQEKQGAPCDWTPAEEAAMISDRNTKWMKELPAILKEAPTFVAVGALHLTGEQGLLNLLKQKGYTVEPVK